MTKKTTTIIIVTIIILGLIIVLTHKNKDVGTATDASKYSLLNSSDVYTVKHGDFNNIIAFTGDLAPLNQTIVASEVNAEVLQVKVSEGEFVHKNQVLAILDDSDLTQSVNAEEAIVAEKEATFKLNQKKLVQQKELFEQGFISKIAYDELNTNYQSSTELIKQEKAKLAQAQKQLSYAIVRAPFSGYIYKKYTDHGQLASKNGKLFALASLNEMQIKTAIPSEQINQIKINQQVSFSVETSSNTYIGKITRINPVAEEGTRSFFVYINFNNDVYKLKSGQFVKGKINLTQLSNVDYISNDVIRTNSNGKYVFLLLKNKVVSKPVTILLNNSTENTCAISGVSTNDTVISASIVNLKPGDLAKIVN